jgi:hypothetical protein
MRRIVICSHIGKFKPLPILPNKGWTEMPSSKNSCFSTSYKKNNKQFVISKNHMLICYSLVKKSLARLKKSKQNNINTMNVDS